MGPRGGFGARRGTRGRSGGLSCAGLRDVVFVRWDRAAREGPAQRWAVASSDVRAHGGPNWSFSACQFLVWLNALLKVLLLVSDFARIPMCGKFAHPTNHYFGAHQYWLTWDPPWALSVVAPKISFKKF